MVRWTQLTVALNVNWFLRNDPLTEGVALYKDFDKFREADRPHQNMDLPETLTAMTLMLDS